MSEPRRTRAALCVEPAVEDTNVPIDPIAAALASAYGDWIRSHEPRRLRRALLDVLRLTPTRMPLSLTSAAFDMADNGCVTLRSVWGKVGAFRIRVSTPRR